MPDQEIVDKVLCDEAVIHHVDQASRRRIDHRFYVCWAFCQNPSRIPQLVYLTLTDRHGDPRFDAQLHFSRPRNIKFGHTFRVLIRIDSVEDLMFYNHPPEQLLAEGKTQLREFFWRPGQLDGDMEDEDQLKGYAVQTVTIEGVREKMVMKTEIGVAQEAGRSWEGFHAGLTIDGRAKRLTGSKTIEEAGLGGNLPGSGGNVARVCPLRPVEMASPQRRRGPCGSYGLNMKETVLNRQLQRSRNLQVLVMGCTSNLLRP
jgi:hypothetical protein